MTSWRRCPRRYICCYLGGEAHAAISVVNLEAKPTQYAIIMEAKPTQYAIIMEAKPTQYAVIMEAHDQVVSELEAYRPGDCTGP